MNLKPFSGPGSTPARKRFWKEVHAAVLSATKLAGRHVSVDEHPGKGSVINVYDASARRGSAPAGCPTLATITFAGVLFECGCVPRDIWTDITFNQSYGLTFSSLSGTTCEWTFSSDLAIIQDAAYTAADCTGFFGNFFFGIRGRVDYDTSTGNWNVFVTEPDASRQIFFGSEAAITTPAANTVACNLPSFQPGIATGGTAILS